MNPLRVFLRLLLMHSHSSRRPTGITPLSQIHSVVIYVCQDDPHCEPAKIMMKHFFESRGINVRIICSYDRNIRTSSDLFLAMNNKVGISERYAARSSTAKYKVGRHQLRRNIYDVVVTDSSEEPMKVDVMFDAVKDILLKVE